MTPTVRLTAFDKATASHVVAREQIGERCRKADYRPTFPAHPAHPPHPAQYNCRMARYTLVYGVRLIPEGSLKGVEEGTLMLADGSSAGLTLHTFDGTIPQLRRSLDRSLDAFFDLLPGAADEDVEKFGD